jgi:pimeloyl-ACP methyl ester carboxylesterase
LLLHGLRQAYGQDLPLVLYGFSGGAHFVSGFAEREPERVAAWCAYSAGWWDRPVANSRCPPGVVACGENDPRLGASLVYFKQGRAVGKPWLWITVPHTGHSIYPPVESFVRNYFAAILGQHHSLATGEWVDIDYKRATDAEAVQNQPSETAWLPDRSLLTEWQDIH